MKKKSSHEISARTLDHISHQLTSPLASIKSLLFLLKRNQSAPDKVAQYAETIEEKADLLNERLKLFLTFFAYRENKATFLYEFFQVPSLLSQLQTHLKDKGLRVTVSEGKEKQMVADKDSIVHALSDWIRALAQTMKPSQILLTTESEKKMLVVRITFTNPARNRNSEKHDLSEREMKEFIATQVIRLHGGTVMEEKKKQEHHIIVKLPFQPKKMRV